ncbi:helix-turn-helix domain-containing protein [Aquimarina sp. 2201CG5-10]|uniref:helix-turn-helix domain-containing protein n=1 Tax=Aquimarina callyspongiae TaxID=3098150 RepID=UPI002AB4D57B|nr:helix-turn-helix domain-containing protein [Aquimarina sp. 2201CG5-10]MDY8137503.1 helix-turn-helix domain-containing protein [Aquimarina sp. 2201CG5-10]
MDSNTTSLRDIKKMRLERHWSQEQLAEMSGLSIRTIQRIENGENAGLESLKALASVFETNITDSNKKEEIEQIRKEEEYVEKVKGFYKLLGLAIFSLIIFFILAVFNSEAWFLFFYMLIYWALFLGIYSLNYFDFFGEEWKRKIINKKFKKKE